MQKDPWIFNYRSHCYDDSDSDSDHSLYGSKSKISEECRLRSELDISTRPDAAIFKPNPFSIAKMNAFTRSLRPIEAKPTQSAEKPKNIGTIDAFFGKTVRGKRSPKELLTTSSRNFLRSSREISTGCHNVEKRPSKPPESRMARHPHSPDNPNLNVVETTSNRPHQIDAEFSRHNPDTQCGSSGEVAHTPIRVCIQEKSSPHILSPPSKKAPDSIYGKAAHAPSPGACSGHRAVVHNIPPGKENQPGIPREDPYPLISARKQESPLTIIPSTTDKKMAPVAFKPNYVSCVTSDISPETIVRSRRAPMKRLFKYSKVDSMTHVSASAVRNSPRCYETKPDEDESWSTLPSRKKFKPSVQPISKYKTTEPFRIPGLRRDSNAVTTGMSATSSTRVITFLPTPLLPDSPRGQNKAEFESLSSPQSSPQSQYCSSFADESGGTDVRSSSPPTSDFPEANCDLKIHWETHHLAERYAQVAKAIEEV